MRCKTAVQIMMITDTYVRYAVLRFMMKMIFDNAANDDNDKTQTFKAVNGENYQPQNNNNNNNNDYNDNQYDKQQNNNGNNKNSEKKSLIIIAILAVLLIAIVSSIAVIAHNKIRIHQPQHRLPRFPRGTSFQAATPQKKELLKKPPNPPLKKPQRKPQNPFG